MNATSGVYVVIGANGQVGQEFAKWLAPERLLLLTHEQIEVADPVSIDKCLRGVSCSAIINLAAFHNVNACEENPEKAFHINAIGAAHVADAARRIGCRVVYFSTDYVFGQTAGRNSPYVESDTVGPLNLYGASKVAGELLVRATQSEHLLVRTSSLFGAVTSRKGSTFPDTILRRAMAGEPLRVVNDQFMTPTYTFDLVGTVIKLLDAGASGTVHVANTGGCTWHEFACAALNLAGIDREVEAVSSEAFPSAARRPGYSPLASERLAALKLPELRDWRAALRAYLTEKGVVTTGLPMSGSPTASARAAQLRTS